jgi:hypothetical protein
MLSIFITNWTRAAGVAVARKVASIYPQRRIGIDTRGNVFSLRIKRRLIVHARCNLRSATSGCQLLDERERHDGARTSTRHAFRTRGLSVRHGDDGTE